MERFSEEKSSKPFINGDYWIYYINYDRIIN